MNGYPAADKNLYTIRAVPFSDIKSIRRHIPTLGWQYIIIVLSSGIHIGIYYIFLTDSSLASFLLSYPLMGICSSDGNLLQNPNKAF